VIFPAMMPVVSAGGLDGAAAYWYLGMGRPQWGHAQYAEDGLSWSGVCGIR
jgi:hypothetical protein